MQVIILGGQSPRHYEWVRELRETLEFAGLPVVLHDYAHWIRGEHKIDFEAELALLAKVVAEQEDDYIIVAKSIGCILTVVGIARGLFKPKACLLLGVPIKTAKSYKELFAGLAAMPTTIFAQNEHDPFGSYEAVKTFARPVVPPATLFVELPGHTHDYADFELIAVLTARLAKSISPPETLRQ